MSRVGVIDTTYRVFVAYWNLLITLIEGLIGGDATPVVFERFVAFPGQYWWSMDRKVPRWDYCPEGRLRHRFKRSWSDSVLPSAATVADDSLIVA